MFLCTLCQKETVYVSSFCNTCQEISKIIQVVGHEEALHILDNICIRDKVKRENKIKNEIKQDKKEIKEEDKKEDKTEDKTDVKVKTRSSSKKLHQDL